MIKKILKTIYVFIYFGENVLFLYVFQLYIIILLFPKIFLVKKSNHAVLLLI